MKKQDRVDGHLWITVLAYHLIQNCLYQLSQNEIQYHRKAIRSIMDRRIRVILGAA